MERKRVGCTVGSEKGKNNNNKKKPKTNTYSKCKKRLTIDKSLINSALNCSFVHLCCTGGVLKVSISMESLLSTTQKGRKTTTTTKKKNKKDTLSQLINLSLSSSSLLSSSSSPPLLLSLMTSPLLTTNKEPTIDAASNKIKASQIKIILMFCLLMKWAKLELLGKYLPQQSREPTNSTLITVTSSVELNMAGGKGACPFLGSYNRTREGDYSLNSSNPHLL